MPHEWIRTKMPVLLTFNLTGSDQWLRDGIHGESFVAPKPQQVIVQGTDEANRVVAKMANLKLQRAQPYGGAMSEMWRGGKCE